MKNLDKLLKLQSELKKYANGGIADYTPISAPTSIAGYNSVDDELQNILEASQSPLAQNATLITPLISPETSAKIQQAVKPEVDFTDDSDVLDDLDFEAPASVVAKAKSQPLAEKPANVTQDKWDKMLQDYQDTKESRDKEFKSAQDLDSMVSIGNSLARAFGNKDVRDSSYAQQTASAQEKQLGDLMGQAKIQNLIADKKNPFLVMNLGDQLVRVNKTTGEAEYVSPTGERQPGDPLKALDAELKRQDIQSRIDSRQGMEKNREFNRGEKNQPRESTRKNFAESTNLLNKIDSAVSGFDPNAIGPAKGRLNKALTTMYGLDPKDAAYQANVGTIMADYIKSISGAAVSDQERAALSKLVPNTAMTPDVFKSVLQNFRKSTLSNLQANINAAELGGDDVSKYRDEYNRSRDFDSAAAESKIASIIKANTKDGKKPSRSEVIDELKKAGKIPNYYQ